MQLYRTERHFSTTRSAGSLVGVQITSDLTLDELFRRQVDPDLHEGVSAAGRPHTVADRFYARQRRTGRRRRVLKRFGALALKMPADAQAARRNMIAAQLPSPMWPERCLVTVAVDVESGPACVRSLERR